MNREGRDGTSPTVHVNTDREARTRVIKETWHSKQKPNREARNAN